MGVSSRLALFSSPDHEVLMVSFCDRPMSVVRRASSVVHNFFKPLPKHRANLDETWQGCSLGEALPKLFKRLNSSPAISLVAMATRRGKKKKKKAKSLENLFGN